MAFRSESDVDLTDVITDAVTDSITPETTEPAVEAAADTAADITSASDTTAEPETDKTIITQPGDADAAADPFAKQHGLPPQIPGMRENRIPYSRVKKISDSAVKTALTPVQAELTTAKQRLAEFEPRVTEYEGRLAQVAQFEQIMVNDPEKFLNMLATLPQYQQIFSQLTQAPATATPGADGMPQPDQRMPDGSMGYSLEGFEKYNSWRDAQVEKRITSQISERYKPIEQQWQAQRQLEAVIPVIQKQIDEARQWPQFKENEATITQALQADRTLSLEGAYRKVVFPNIVADREKMRKELLEEMRKAPTSTSAPGGSTRPGTPSTGPRTVEDAIRDSIAGLTGR